MSEPQDPYFVTARPTQPVVAGIPAQPQAYPPPQAYPAQYPPPQAYPPPQSYPPPQAYPPGYGQPMPVAFAPPTTPPIEARLAGRYRCTNCGYPAGDQAFCPQCGCPTSFAPPGAIPPHASAGVAPARRYVDLAWRDLLPIEDWMRSGIFWKGRIGLFLACALTPFLLLQATIKNTDARYAAWGFTIYFAVIWLIAIRALIKPEKVSVSRILIIIAMTAVIGVSVAITLERHINADAVTLARSVFTIGIPEELGESAAAAAGSAADEKSDRTAYLSLPRRGQRPDLRRGRVDGLQRAVQHRPRAHRRHPARHRHHLASADRFALSRGLGRHRRRLHRVRRSRAPAPGVLRSDRSRARRRPAHAPTTAPPGIGRRSSSLPLWCCSSPATPRRRTTSAPGSGVPG